MFHGQFFSFSFRWSDSSAKISIHVPSLRRSASETTPVSAVVAERASSSHVSVPVRGGAQHAGFRIEYSIFFR